MGEPHIMILGIGNILFTDEGFGVRVIEKLYEDYEFPENVSLVDGGVLGLNLLGTIVEADRLIVVDAVRNRSAPGTFHRLEGDAIPERVRAKNSLHQIDFLEALTMCQALDKVPQTLVLGVEPEDIETLGIELTPILGAQVGPMVDRVLAELSALNVSYRKRKAGHVSGDTL